MNEELKKYVRAFMDGEEVEFLGTRWNLVTGLRYFTDEDGQEEPADRFRIKPKAEDKWQRVIDEGYLCKFWDTDTTNTNLSILKAYDTESVSYPFQDDTTEKYAHCEVLRKQGYIQPYFQGDDIPEIEGKVVIYFKNGDVDVMYNSEGAKWIDWSEVAAYIEI